MSEIKREFTGVFVPAHIWTNKELLPAERMLLAEIASLSQKTGWCEAGRKHFADWLNCDITNVSYYTSKLEKLGFLEKQQRFGYKPRMRVITERFYVENYEDNQGIPVNPIHGGGESHSRGGVNPIHGGGEPHSLHKYNINISIKEEEESAQARNLADEKIFPLKAVDNTPPPIAPRPPHDFCSVDIESEAENMLKDGAFLMSFSSRGLPSEKAPELVRAFCVDVKGRGQSYNRIREFRSHCLNWCERRHNIMKPKAAPNAGPNQKMRVI